MKDIPGAGRVLLQGCFLPSDDSFLSGKMIKNATEIIIEIIELLR
jgi:hypothetical protein